MPEPMYQSLVGRLQVPEAVLTAHRPQIVEELKGAYPTEGLSHEGRIYTQDDIAIERSINLASSVVLQAPNLGAMMDEIRRDPILGKYDATTVITTAYLYHMVTAPQVIVGSSAEELQDPLRQIRGAYDKVHWLLSPEAMQQLGMKKLEERVQ